VPLDQDGEGQLGGLAPAGREPLQELAVGQLPDRPDAEERAKLPGDRPVLANRHGDLSARLPDPIVVSNATTRAAGSAILE